MRVLFDTNVVLDVLPKREPYEENARWLVDRVEKGYVNGLLGSTTVTTIYYVASKSQNPLRAVSGGNHPSRRCAASPYLADTAASHALRRAISARSRDHTMFLG